MSAEKLNIDTDVKDLLYKGKAKSLYSTVDPEVLLCDFRDDTSAFDGGKTAKLADKGSVNNQFNAHVMSRLEEAGIKTHWLDIASPTASWVKHLDMLPIECVVRNVAAGSICRRLGIEKGFEFKEPLFEFFLKNDDLNDPLITVEHIIAFGWATAEEVAELKRLTLAVNEILLSWFEKAGLILVDFKIEFGRLSGALVLGDEFSPDGCRVWDKETRASLDKDRFRQDLGDVVESYQIIAHKLGFKINNE